MTRVAVVFNPSKASDALKAKQEICEALLQHGISDPLWLETSADDPGTGQAEAALADGAGLVFVSGGDGTVMACVGVLAGTGVPLAVIPAGTGNLLARNFGIPRDVVGAVAAAVDGVDRSVDVGVLGEQRFVIMAGIGFDAQMLADAPDKLKAKVGWPAYVVSAARHLFAPRRSFSLTLDEGQPLQRKGRGVLVGNLGRLQGGLPVLPDAVPDDGLLDVAVINTRGLLSWAFLATAVVLRRGDQRRLETFQARRITVRCDERLPTELDGEVLDDRDTLEISVLPGALTLRVPAEVTKP
ncbi:diacylglycerol kinase family protein [Acidothermaceae bacterium B102]|nr:diacylglycerol kinase family protein [Acidothermaceae bacterium B102]